MFVRVVVSLLFLQSIQVAFAQADIVNTARSISYSESYCQIESIYADINQALEKGGLPPEEITWLTIAKANYLEYCLLDSEPAYEILLNIYNRHSSNLIKETKATLWSNLSEYDSYDPNGFGCNLLASDEIRPLSSLKPVTSLRIKLHQASHCGNYKPIVRYQKLIDIQRKVQINENPFLTRLTVDAFYNFFIENNMLNLAAEINEELLALFQDSHSPHHLALRVYLHSLDSLHLGRLDESEYYLSMFEALVFNKQRAYMEKLVQSLKLQLYFATQDYQQAFVYAEKLLPEYQSFKNYANSGKLAIIRATICLELNKTSCVEGFVGDLENQVTDEDYKQEYLPYFLARYQSLDNSELSNQIFEFQQLWQKKINKAQDSSLRQAIAQVSQNALISDVTENTLNSEEKTFNNRSIIIFGIFVSVFISITLIFNRKQTKPTDFDDLTHLYTRRAALKKSISVAKLGKNQPHAIVLFDLDNFKLLNQRFGYLTGDLALNQIAQLTTNYVRESDIVGRLSGEEFFIFMPFTSRDVAIDRVKKLKKQIDSHTITTLSGDKTKLTASFAVSFVKDYKQIEKEVEILHQSIAKQQPISTLSPVICL